MKHPVLLAAILFCGCGSSRNAVTQSLRDSIRVETVVRTEHVTDTVMLEVPVERLVQVQDTFSHLETGFAVSDAGLRTDGKLYHTLANKSGKRPYGIKKEIVYRDSIVYRDKANAEVRTVEVVKPLTRWQRFEITGFWLLLSLCVAVAAYKLKRLSK